MYVTSLIVMDVDLSDSSDESEHILLKTVLSSVNPVNPVKLLLLCLNRDFLSEELNNLIGI